MRYGNLESAAQTEQTLSVESPWPPDPPSPEKPSLQADPLLHQQATDFIKNSTQQINDLIMLLGNDTSYLTQAAKFWGGLPAWQKVCAGTVLTASALAISIIVQTATVITLSITFTVLSISGGLLLDDHLACSH